jgi:hypothetical protein
MIGSDLPGNLRIQEISRIRSADGPSAQEKADLTHGEIVSEVRPSGRDP